MSEDAPPPRRISFLSWLRDSFAAGVAIALPFLVTAWLAFFVVGLIDAHVIPILPREAQPFARNLPGVGVALALVTLTLVGALAGNLVGRFIVGVSERLIGRFPIVRSIYGGSKQIFSQLASPDSASFKRAVLVEFPSPGLWSIGFVTHDSPPRLAEGVEELVAVFIPLAPLPTTGFLVYARRDALRPVAEGADEGLRQILSLGIAKKGEGGGPASRM